MQRIVINRFHNQLQLQQIQNKHFTNKIIRNFHAICKSIALVFSFAFRGHEYFFLQMQQ